MEGNDEHNKILACSRHQFAIISLSSWTNVLLAYVIRKEDLTQCGPRSSTTIPLHQAIVRLTYVRVLASPEWPFCTAIRIHKDHYRSNDEQSDKSEVLDLLDIEEIFHFAEGCNSNATTIGVFIHELSVLVDHRIEECVKLLYDAPKLRKFQTYHLDNTHNYEIHLEFSLFSLKIFKVDYKKNGGLGVMQYLGSMLQLSAHKPSIIGLEKAFQSGEPTLFIVVAEMKSIVWRLVGSARADIPKEMIEFDNKETEYAVRVLQKFSHDHHTVVALLKNLCISLFGKDMLKRKFAVQFQGFQLILHLLQIYDCDCEVVELCFNVINIAIDGIDINVILETETVQVMTVYIINNLEKFQNHAGIVQYTCLVLNTMLKQDLKVAVMVMKKRDLGGICNRICAAYISNGIIQIVVSMLNMVFTSALRELNISETGNNTELSHSESYRSRSRTYSAREGKRVRSQRSVTARMNVRRDDNRPSNIINEIPGSPAALTARKRRLQCSQGVEHNETN